MIHIIKYNTFLLLVFLLVGCSSFGGLEVDSSKTEIVTVKGDVFRCDYSRGVRFNCELIGKDFENE